MYEELIKRLRASCESCKLWDGYKCCLKGECSAQTRLQAADAIERLDAIAQTYAETVHEIEDKRKWIPVTERLPEKIGYYLAHIANINQMSRATDVVTLWDGSHFHVGSFVVVTHWMPLPQPPKDGES